MAMASYSPAQTRKLATTPSTNTAITERITTRALIGGGIIASVVALSLVPPPLLVPAFSLVAFAGAAIAGGIAWFTKAERRGPNVTVWDVAGACVFIGIGAGMLSGPASVMQLFGLATPM
jgi:hypothetical protein